MFDMKVKHRPRTKHLNADALSRVNEESPCSEYKPEGRQEDLPCGGILTVLEHTKIDPNSPVIPIMRYP